MIIKEIERNIKELEIMKDSDREINWSYLEGFCKTLYSNIEKFLCSINNLMDTSLVSIFPSVSENFHENIIGEWLTFFDMNIQIRNKNIDGVIEEMKNVKRYLSKVIRTIH